MVSGRRCCGLLKIRPNLEREKNSKRRCCGFLKIRPNLLKIRPNLESPAYDLQPTAVGVPADGLRPEAALVCIISGQQKGLLC